VSLRRWWPSRPSSSATTGTTRTPGGVPGYGSFVVRPAPGTVPPPDGTLSGPGPNVSTGPTVGSGPEVGSGPTVGGDAGVR
jgi:hypothetical protein